MVCPNHTSVTYPNLSIRPEGFHWGTCGKVCHHNSLRNNIVQKCNMDRNCPDYYVESSAEASIADTEALIGHIRSLSASSASPSLVRPILTPRFAISCTPALLTSLGTLASSEPSLHIQTHISENPSEVSFTRSLFPHCSSYADVYNHYGLLRQNTILAHGVHLSEDETRLIKEKGAGISHCPTSNFNLSSGIARVGELLDKGIKARITFCICC
jgi:guanine deaminase